MNAKKLITKHGLQKLEEDLNHRTIKVRKEIADKLDVAKALGDLSENSAYTSALEEYQHNEKRIDELKKLIKTLEIAPDKSGDSSIDIGDLVELEDTISNKVLEYRIVGIGEGDPVSGSVSSDSIVGSALLGKKVGEFVRIKLPQKELQYKILKVS